MSGDSGWRKEDSYPGINGCVGGTDAKACNGFPIHGTNRCYFHTHPMRRHDIKRAKAGRELQRVLDASIFNGDYDGLSVMEGLLRETRRTLVIITWLGNKLDAMARENPEQFAQIVTMEAEEGTKPLAARSVHVETNVLRRQLVRTEGGMNPWLVWFLRERDHYLRCCGLALQMGIKLDQLQFAKQQGAVIAEAMGRLAIDIGADINDPSTMARIIAALEEAGLSADPSLMPWQDAI